MSSDEQALLNAINAAPADDVPRLVYADWLDEHNRPERAEFIRVQCELAQVRIADPGGREQYDLLSHRYQELYAAHCRTWEREAVVDLPAHRQLSVLFSRGMVGEVSCTTKYFLEHGEKVVSQFPLQCLRLMRLSEAHARALASFPPFQRVTGIRFLIHSTTPRDVLAVLTYCPLSHLRSITLSDYIVNSATSQYGPYSQVVAALAQCEQLASLNHMDLSAAGIGDDGGLALAASSALRSLEYLDVMHNSLTPNVQTKLRKRYGDALILDYPDRQRFPIGRVWS
jgi:uncharacterized protein (TIGR02996 family)